MDNLKKSRCLLKSVEATHPHIEISTNSDTLIGRTRESQLDDTLVSKKHIKMRADFDKKCVIFEILGLNPSTLNGVTLEKNKKHKAFQDDIIEIIPSKYPYKIHFELANHSRKRSADDKTIESPPKRMKYKIGISLDANKQGTNTSWESYNNGQLLVYTSPNCQPSEKIAAYDMDGTLIKTQSGKVFPTDIDDWTLAFGPVTTTLKSKHSDGFKIVILTNQAGVTSGKTKVADIKKKIENVIKALCVPVQVFVATGDNYFRKPMTGMWQALCDQKNGINVVDMNQSYFVGDAAGRPEIKAMKKKKDHSSADRLMAINLNLTFFTPEEHFLKVPTQNWIKPEFNPKDYLKRTVQMIDEPRTKITSTDLELILLVGGPGTGKSRFCKDHLEGNYEIVSRDVIGTWQKCVDRVNDCLKTKRKVVVDNTNGDRESRARYVNAAKKHKVPCRCFVMTTSFKHAEHNIAFRELTDTKHSKINKIVLNSYKKNYQDPTKEEGFTEIVRINFVPKFNDEQDKWLYEMYLLA
ncbi:uncharacterized protein F21D5.5 [Contarinia nasturtii]|uniref:uncharacterized protein F21D5.5 n=1 Tax=Contarinia nasturtii TaxID=265458 RepID=UPI0012D39033|nr:uncharacterized protein F21D5.5 [Contarinia nasturtii]